MRRLIRVLFACLALAFLFELPPRATVHAFVGSPSKRSTTEQSLAIVVNRSNPVENLSFNELRKIFLGERGHWPSGRRVAVVMLEPRLPERQAILREVYRMTESGYRDHFLQGMYNGSVFVVPKTLSSPIVLRKFVFNAPGAIGYLRASDVDGSVKVVRIGGLLPDDPEYTLQIGRRPTE